MKLFNTRLSVAKITAMTAAMAMGAWGASAQITMESNGVGYLTDPNHMGGADLLDGSHLDTYYVDGLINFYNGTGPSSDSTGSSTVDYFRDQGSATPATLTVPTSIGSNVGGLGGNDPSITIDANTMYVIIQWDDGTAGDTVYDVSGMAAGSYTFSNDIFQQGASDYWLVDAASPVPEASTVFASALMLLPLGVGAIRALRKERDAVRIS